MGLRIVVVAGAVEQAGRSRIILFRPDRQLARIVLLGPNRFNAGTAAARTLRNVGLGLCDRQRPARTHQRRGLRRRVTVISFQDDALRETRELLPDIPLALVSGRSTTSAPERAVDLGAVMISSELAHLDADVVGRAHAAGLRVISWTVNTDEDLARVRELGLDGVVTDSPEIVRAVREAA